MDNIQLTIFDYKVEFDWKKTIESVIKEITVQEDLYEDAIYFVNNKRKDTPSYSIALWEKDYPEIETSKKEPGKNEKVVTIIEGYWKTQPDMLRLELKNNFQFRAVPLPSDAKGKEGKTIKDCPIVKIDKSSPNIEDYIRKLIQYSVSAYESKASTFGCCSRFNECSDAKKCIHPNKMYSKACTYRQNLDAGRIFYGKNRNIG